MLVEVETAGGLVGWGEAFGPATISAAVVDHLAPLLIGKDALATDLHWQTMYNALRDHGQRGGAIDGLSAIDIALWDIRGKHFDAPVSVLLGGPLRGEVADAIAYARASADLHLRWFEEPMIPEDLAG